MNFMRRYWHWVGFVVAVVLSIFLCVGGKGLSEFRVLLMISFITLLLHQFEEYRLPGYFPRMVNTVMFKSKKPNRYPLNTNTALIINVGLGWGLYILAIMFAEQAVWLAVASITVSAGNFLAHTLLFNIKGQTLYNPGMLTAVIFFLPLTIYFFVFAVHHDLLSTSDLIVGLILGIAINYFGILKMISILSNKDSSYAFKPFR